MNSYYMLFPWPLLLYLPVAVLVTADWWAGLIAPELAPLGLT
ncbi:MAG TPA: hypothetical protein VE439_06145 [Anaerolineae bacterium]|nr:hypothetical protein [Anaerolineae bacterium]